MSSLVICQSREHQNTQRLASAMADELGAEIVAPSEVTPELIEQHDLIGFGSGIRFTRHYADLMNMVDDLPQQSGKRAFVFSTSGFGTRMWHMALNRRLRARGFNIVGEYCCKGLDTMGMLRLVGGVNKGRPNAEDIGNARSFVRGLP